MVKVVKYTFKGMNQDITESKTPMEFYYSASNVRFTTTDRNVLGGLSFEKGNQLQVTIPDVTRTANIISYNNKTIDYSNAELNALPGSSTDNKIIGYAITRDSVIIFTTSDTGFDCIWEIDNETFDIELLYINDLEFSTDNPIQALFNYENTNIQKIYWVDGKNQIRFLNIKHNSIDNNEALIDIPVNTLNFVGNINFTQPVISDVIGGGNHTSGMIQYAYNLYRLNSSQTKISPLSDLVPLDKGTGLGGGEVNEIVGSTPVVVIDNIDSNYTHIRIYAIKYTSFNQTPSINLIEEREIGTSKKVTIYDDGSTISSLTLEEFLFLGSNPIIPKHIESKDNILFPINIKEKFFDTPDELDCRAYSFPISSTGTTIVNNVILNNSIVTGEGLSVNSSYLVPPKHDAVNTNYDTFKYQFNSTTLGGEGKYLKYSIVQKTVEDPEDKKYFKDNEIYRLGIQFYNILGQTSLPKWIADFKAPQGNLEGNYNTLNVELKPEFYTWLNAYNFEESSDRPIGYKIIRAVRNDIDKTILAQGILTPMMFQVLGEDAKNTSQFASTSIRQNYQDDNLKIPTYLVREFEQIPNTAYTGNGSNNGILQDAEHLKWLNDDSAGLNEGGEIFNGVTQDKISQTFQHTKMLQLYSPEILFENSISFTSDLFLDPIGLCKNTEQGIFAEERNILSTATVSNGKSLGGLNPWHINSNEYLENNNFTAVFNVSASNRGPANNIYGFIGPTGSAEVMDFKQYYRAYNTYLKDTGFITYPIYGTPEITSRGAASKFYNNDPRYNYSNSLQSFISDGNGDDRNKNINSINSFNTDCITLVLGTDSMDTNTRPALEHLHNSLSVGDTDGVILAEIKKTTAAIYSSNIYGGHSFEDKKRTNYIEIGTYVPIGNTSIQIDSPGDTFVQNFKFLRINKTDTEVYNNQETQISEIVEYTTETTVDLKNRHDLSLSEWDSRFQPRYDEYTLYNRVYSQNSNIVTSTDVDFTFNKIKNYDTRIQATKTKIPNETVDSWSDLLQNTVMDLDGKYGPINSTVNFRDEVYTFQDNAIAVISINPRIQIQGSDGASVELGKGTKLDDYQYISTKSGCINKWGVIATNSSIYYLDGLNKSFNRFSRGLENLSDSKGMHKYLFDNLDIPNLRIDNPLLSTGVSIGYDQINNDIYLSYNNSWTLCFNELLNVFTGFYSYDTPHYIYNKEKLLTVNKNGLKTIYETHAGQYNIFYDEIHASRLRFLCNPEPDVECTFNNLEYKSEAYNENDVEQRYTWEKIRIFNEFQESGTQDLNLRKLNRKYRVTLPRNRFSRDRIRNTWAYIELSSNNVDNLNYINHDILLYYVPNYIMIQ